MAIRPGLIKGMYFVERETLGDQRGFFRESFRLNELADVLGYEPKFVQENHARSQRGVLRGLHPENWDKLIYVSHGEVFAAVADVRPGSPTFGVVETYHLGESNRAKVFLPRGVANGYCVLSDSADYIYLVTEYWDGSDTRAIAWNDPDLAVPWPIKDPILSERDRRAPTLRQLLPEQFR